MKLCWFPAQTRGLSWKIESEPFSKLQVDLVFGRNKRDRAFLPIVGGNMIDLDSYQHVEVRKNQKGTYLIKPISNDAGNGFLALLTVEGGFRGGCSVYKCEGEIISKAAASAACESAVALATVLQPGQKIVILSTGRYGSLMHVFMAGESDVTRSVLPKTEYEFYYEDNIE